VNRALDLFRANTSEYIWTRSWNGWACDTVLDRRTINRWNLFLASLRNVPLATPCHLTIRVKLEVTHTHPNVEEGE
jgi:hypothetical protein